MELLTCQLIAETETGCITIQIEHICGTCMSKRTLNIIEK